ncbi:MAG: hypothetical protein ACQEP8_01865 [Chlamydiota bacterium]
MEESRNPSDYMTQLEQELLERDEVPLLGEPPSFPWEAVEQGGETLFQQNIELTHREWRWRDADNLQEGLGEQQEVVHFVTSPLEGRVAWFLSEKDIEVLFDQLLLGQASQESIIIDPGFRQGFYRFMIIEVFHILDKAGFPGDLSLRVAGNQESFRGPALCIDVGITIADTTIWGRLALEDRFRRQWAAHYAPQRPTSLSKELARKIDVTVVLEAGRTTLSPQDWKQLEVGDCVLLDQCGLEPGTDKNSVVLSLEGKPFLRGNLVEGGVQLEEYGVFEEDRPSKEAAPQEEDSQTEEERPSAPDDKEISSEEPFDEELDEDWENFEEDDFGDLFDEPEEE